MYGQPIYQNSDKFADDIQLIDWTDSADFNLHLINDDRSWDIWAHVQAAFDPGFQNDD